MNIQLYSNRIKYVDLNDYNNIDYSDIIEFRGDYTVPIHGILDGSCKNIILNDLLDYFPRSDMLDYIVKKLSYNGELVLYGLDMREIARNIITDKLSLEQTNTLINNKFSISCMDDILELLQKKSLTILTKRIGDYYYHIRVKRPTPTA